MKEQIERISIGYDLMLLLEKYNVDPTTMIALGEGLIAEGQSRSGIATTKRLCVTLKQE